MKLPCYAFFQMHQRLRLIAVVGMIVITASLLFVSAPKNPAGQYAATVTPSSAPSCGNSSFDLLNEGMQGNIRKVSFFGNKAYVLLSNGYLAVINASTDTVLKIIQVAGSDIAFSYPNAYVLGNNVVSVINTESLSLTQTVPVGKNPIAIVFSGSKAFVANNEDNTVSVIHTDSLSVSNTIALGGASYRTPWPGNILHTRHPVAMAVVESKIYVGNIGDIASPSINVIDSETETLGNPIEAGAQILAIAYAGPLAHATDGRNAYVIDPATDTVVGNPIPLPGVGNVTSIRLAGSKAYFPGNNGSVAILDRINNSVKIVEHLGTSTNGQIGFYDNKAYVTDSGGSDKVYVIDTDTATLKKAILIHESAGYHPLGIAVDGSKVYVPNNQGGAVTIIDASTDSIPAACPSIASVCENGRIPLGDLEPKTLAVSNGKLYVGHWWDHAISVIDPVRNSVTGIINDVEINSFLPFGTNLFAIGNPTSFINTTTDSVEKIHSWGAIRFLDTVRAVLPNYAVIANDKLFVADYIYDYDGKGHTRGSMTYILNPQTFAEVGTTFTVGNGAADFAVVGDKVYVANLTDGTVSVFNALTNSVFKTIAVGSNHSTTKHLIAVPTAAGTMVYVTNFENANGSVKVINPSSNAIVRNIPVGSPPFELVSARNYVYVANTASASVSVIDTRVATNTTVATIPVGYYPVAFAVSGTKVYVACEGMATGPVGGGTVYVIDTVSNTLVGDPIAVGHTPSALAIIGNKLYVAVTDLSGGDNSMAVIDIRSNTLACGEPVYSSASSSLFCPVPGCVGVYPTGTVDSRGCPVYACPGSSSSSSFFSSSSSTSVSPLCGNGWLDAGEQCETNIPCPAGFFCTNLCQCSSLPSSASSFSSVQSVPSAVCGNGRLEIGEQCDDYNIINGDGCSFACFTERGWSCSGLVSLCSPLCGDGLRAGEEQCDDGNLFDHDGCNHLCKIDSIFSSSASSYAVLYSSSSSTAARCGNGRLEGIEECESGLYPCPLGFSCNNTLCRCFAVTSSRASSRISSVPSIPLCGNNLLEVGEQCERSIPCIIGTCSSSCTCVEASSESSSSSSGSSVVYAIECGNTLLEPGEQCETGVVCPSGFFCSNLCQCSSLPVVSSVPSAVCGNGIMESDEQCERGFPCYAGLCDSWCQCGDVSFSSSSEASSLVVMRTSVCGNGVAEEDEQCDDGNMVATDGCSLACQFELGYSCFGEPSNCLPVCGDGLQMPPEECDDGNNADGDGCSSVCTIEHGAAESSRAPTLPNCGNGIPEVGEECDDGNTIDGDGCSAFCLREVLFVSSSFATSSFSVVQSSAASLIPVFSAFSSSSSVFFIPPVVTEQAPGIGLGWILLLLTIILALCVPVVVLFLKLRRKSDT